MLKEQHMPRSVGNVLKMAAHGTSIPSKIKKMALVYYSGPVFFGGF
jgi:hypothetical protein